MAGAGVAPPLPLPSGVAYGGEVADEQEMVEEEVGSVAQPRQVHHPLKQPSLCLPALPLFWTPDLGAGKSLRTLRPGSLDQAGTLPCFDRTYIDPSFGHAPGLPGEAPGVSPSRIHRSR